MQEGFFNQIQLEQAYQVSSHWLVQKVFKAHQERGQVCLQCLQSVIQAVVQLKEPLCKSSHKK